MADIAATRQLFVRMGFTQAAANALTDEQGIANLDELRLLTDSECSTLCKTLRRPGGTIIPAGGGGPVANPGHSVSLVAEKNLKLAVYYLKHKKRCHLNVTFPDVTAENVRELQSLYDQEAAYEKPDAPDAAKIINTKDWVKTFEAINEHLSTVLGVRGVPLAYVVRKETDPQDEPDGGWPTDRDQMIARCPHFTTDGAGAFTENHTVDYKADNLEVWNILSGLTRNLGDCWTYVKAGQQRKDGRVAYLSLFDHYLGKHMVEIQANFHENRLRTNQYHGEKRRHNFHKYATEQLDSIQSLNNLRDVHGYAGVDERSAVRYLTEGIKDSSLDSCKNAILADDRLRSDFTACVGLFKDFINQRKTSEKQQPVNVAELSTTTQDAKNDGKQNAKKPQRGNTGVEFRYYKQAEYKKLSNEQKEELKKWRETRDQGTQQPKAKRRKQSGGTFNMSQVAQVIAAVSQASNNNQSNEPGQIADSDAATQATDNRTHGALTRQQPAAGGSRRN
jgi:hypothetical protein